MKKAKLKINYHHFVNYYYYEKDEILNYAEDSDMFYRGTSKNKIEGEFVRLNPEIFELIEEPQEEVIEGYAWERQEGKYHFVKPDQPIVEGAIDSILILNPKPKKEYVRWVMKEFIDNLKTGHPIYRVLATESDYEKYCHKIKITVEDSE